MEMRGQFPLLSLQSLYTAIVGPRAEQHDAASDAEAVYHLLEAAFGSPLSLNIPQVRTVLVTQVSIAPSLTDGYRRSSAIATRRASWRITWSGSGASWRSPSR